MSLVMKTKLAVDKRINLKEDSSVSAHKPKNPRKAMQVKLVESDYEGEKHVSTG
jgi:hypothetical protein